MSSVVTARKVCHATFVSPLPSPLSPFPLCLSGHSLVSWWTRGSAPPAARAPAFAPISSSSSCPPKAPTHWVSFVRSFVRFTLPFEKGATAFLPCSFLFPCAPSPPSLRHRGRSKPALRLRGLYPSVRLHCMKMSYVVQGEKEGKKDISDVLLHISHSPLHLAPYPTTRVCMHAWHLE